MTDLGAIHGLDRATDNLGWQVLVAPDPDTANSVGRMLAPRPVAAVSWRGDPEATDWAPLAGRRVILWAHGPIQPGNGLDALAGLLLGFGCRLRMVDGDQGLADAVADGWDASRIIDYAKARAHDWTGPQEREVMPSEADEIRRSKHTTETRPHHVAPRGDGGAALKLDLGIGTGGTNPTNPAQHKVGNVQAIHGATIPLPDDLDDYRSHMIADENGKIKPKINHNFFWMLRGHPATRGLFAWNEMATDVFVMARPPWDKSDGPWRARALLEADIYSAMTWLEVQGLLPRKPDARDAIKNIATFTRYNPVRDYLNGLRWDGCPRLQGGAWESDTVPPLSTEYLGAPPDPIFGTFVTKWHVAAVARVFGPGVKADAMIIFESPQGKFKSTYLRTMATIDGHEYFADSLGDITNAGSIMLLQGTWIVEVAELSGFDRKEVNHIKAWLSRTTDRYVPKYEGQPRDVPRNYIVAGTHNPSGHGYLKDPTGARRFWPVPITEVDLDRVERDRDQIWAEAVTLFKAGVRWWLSADEERQADELTWERRVEDPWAAKIEETVKGLQTVTLGAVIAALGVPVAQQSEITTKRISEHLKSAGYAQGRDKTWRRSGEAVQGDML